MAAGQTGGVLRHLRGVALARGGAGPADGQLLADHLAGRDPAALAALVRRHGPMVWGVCRRVVGNHHDAEDAFQATFLVLVRKAGSVASPDLLANWLYGVAHQTALNARRAAARRRAREKQVADMPEPEATRPDPPDPPDDLRPRLDRELARLPEKYRAPVVLCDLEGKTRKEAARLIGCPEGTVAGRLARARALLARRLGGPGRVVGVAAVAAALARDAAAGPPAALVARTVEAAGRFAAGSAAAAGTPAAVLALTERVVTAMLTSKLKAGTAVLAVVAAAALGAGGLLDRTRAADPPPGAKADPPAARGKSPAGKPVVVKDDGQLAHVAWSADGKTVATVGYAAEVVEPKAGGQKVGLLSHTVKLWDAATGKLDRSLGEEKDTMVLPPAFSRDGTTAAFAVMKLSFDREKGEPGGPGESEVRVLDARTWQQKRRFTTGSANDEAEMTVSAVALSPDGKRLALAGSPRLNSAVAPVPQPGDEPPGRLKLWDVDANKAVERKPKEGEPTPGLVRSLAYSPDGKLIAAGEHRGKVRLFDGRTGEPVGVIDAHADAVHQIVFAPDGGTLVSVGQDRATRLWDVPTGKLRKELAKERQWAAAFSPDGKRLATAGGVEEAEGKWRYEVLLWDARTGEPARAPPAAVTVPVYSLAFSPDGKTLAAAGGFLGDVKDGAKSSGELVLLRLE